ncbi:MAG: carotenoid biosynthesis protein [Ignavibacteria bacterium]|nr:carotenoid biosynthesis protein [Ignavibacteria bacterium]
MEGQKINHRKLTIIFLATFYIVGIVIHQYTNFSKLLSFLTPLFLLVTSTIVIFEEVPSKRFLLWVIASYIFTFLIEVAGVKTGLIFGQYQYGENLGIKIFDVPLIIGLNWVVLILAAVGFVENLKWSSFVKSAFVGLLMFVYDILLEIVAPKLNYWFFDGGIAPLQNYLSWFIISFSFGYLYFYLNIKRSLVIARFNLIFQIIFFLLIEVLK